MRVRQAGGRRGRWGGAVVEMAAVLPIFVFLVFGQIESARLSMASQLLTVAAREGCRVAVIEGKTPDDVQTRINSVLGGSGITPPTPQISPAAWTTAAYGTPITVTLTTTHRAVAGLGPLYQIGDLSLTARATMNRE